MFGVLNTQTLELFLPLGALGVARLLLDTCAPKPQHPAGAGPMAPNPLPRAGGGPGPPSPSPSREAEMLEEVREVSHASQDFETSRILQIS